MLKKSLLFPWLICGLGALFYCYEYLLRIAPNVMAQELMSSFGISAGTFGVMVAFYYHAYTPMQLPVGLMMDRFGPRRLLAFASLLCAIGTYVFVQASFLHLAELGRFMVGLGSAFAFVGVLKLGSLWLPHDRMGLITGCALTVAMLGVAKGNVVIEHATSLLGWRSTMDYFIVGGIILAALIWFLIPNKSQNHDIHAHPVMTFSQLARELLRLARNPQIWLVGIIGALVYLGLSAFAELWGVAYLQRVYNLPHEQAASFNALIFYGWAIGAPCLGYISDKIKKRRLPLIVCSVIALTLSCVLVYFPQNGQHWLGLLLFLFGVFTSIQILVFPIARELNLPHLAGTAIAFMNTLVMLGGNLFQPMIGQLLDMFAGQRGLAKPENLQAFTQHDFQMAMSVLPIGLLVSLIVLFFVKETHAKPYELKEVEAKNPPGNIPPLNCRLAADVVE